MAHVTQSAITWSVHQPADLTMVPNGPRSLNEFEAEGLGAGKSGVGHEELEQLRASEEVGVSIVEYDVRVENRRERIVEPPRYQAQASESNP